MKLVAGVDQVGRGSAAGPVTVCAYIAEISDTKLLEMGVRDSKKIGKKEVLYALAPKLKSCAIAYSIASISSEVIDEVGIDNAVWLAMVQAIAQLSVQPDEVVVDGKRIIPGLQIPQRAIVGGDASVPAIGAASIIAKADRDSLMIELAKQYPLYKWEKNKGYFTEDHHAAIRLHGLTPLHRTSFRNIKFYRRIAAR